MSKIICFENTRHEPLISPQQLADEYPATIAQKNFVEQTQKQIIRILNGEDPRRLLIIGPCSIHDLDSALEFAQKLKTLALEISDVFLPVMRVYFEKARTALGWKGFMYDPHLDGSHDINTGLRMTRRLLTSLAELQVPAAAEILDPISAVYFGDLLSWGCIGARTASSQLHRQAVSGFRMPMGFKNNTDGNILPALHGILSAATPHTYIGISPQGTASLMHSRGNPHCHLVLRGGEKKANYDPLSIEEIVDKMTQYNLPPKILVDCSHDNSRRDPNRQPEVFASVIEQMIGGNKAIRGCILESHLNAGNQEMPKPPSLLKYAISLTDPCMDWATSETIVLAAARRLIISPEPAWTYAAAPQ